MSDLWSIGELQHSGAIRNGFTDLDDGEVLDLAGVATLWRIIPKLKIGVYLSGLFTIGEFQGSNAGRS